jgi:outer membrane protein assembly factor BamB
MIRLCLAVFLPTLALLFYRPIPVIQATEPTAASAVGNSSIPAQSLMERRYLDIEPIRSDPVLKWKVKSLRGAANEEWTHVIVHEGVMYGTARGALHAVDAEGGKLLWTVEGPSGHPTIHEGCLYVTGPSKFFAVDLQTHKIKWEIEASPMQNNWRQTNAFMKPSVVIHDGIAYFGGKAGDTVECHIHAVDIHTGKLLWKRKHNNEPSIANLTIGGGRLYGGSFPDPNPERGPSPHGRDKTPGAIFAMNPKTGNILWSKPMGSVCKPVYQDEVVYYLVGERLVAIDAKTGDTLWTVRATEGFTGFGMALAGDYLVAGSHGPVLRCINVKTQNEAWSFTETGVREVLNPLICRDVVIVSTCAALGGEDHRTGLISPIYGLDLRTGKKLWQCVVPGTDCFENDKRVAWNSYVPGWAYPEKNRLFVFSFTGKFYCFEAPK